MIDIHTHIIWDIDDGSIDKEMSLNMLKTAIESGTTKIIATPHFNKGYFEASVDEIKEKTNLLKEVAKENNLEIEIYSGQEVYYSSNILNHYENGYITTINDSRYMLIEFNMKEFSIEEVLDNIYELQLKGIIPIIAHPERYHIFIKNPMLINKFIREGFLFQLNSGSIIGDFGIRVKKTAEIYVSNKIYNFIGSDAHRDLKRNTDIRMATKKIDSIKGYYSKELIKMGDKLLKDENIEFIGSLVKERNKIFSFWGKLY